MGAQASRQDHDGGPSSGYPDTVPELLAALRELRANNPKAVRDTVHLYPPALYAPEAESSNAATLRERRITSWKMSEHMYHDANNQFPTLARGLFTEIIEEGDELPPSHERKEQGGVVAGKGERERIVARGYDKFFNIDEVAYTSWDGMEKHTEAPYYLTLKSNGCLIMISALSPTHLLVASKHSLGTTIEEDHAEEPTTSQQDGENSAKGVMPMLSSLPKGAESATQPDPAISEIQGEVESLNLDASAFGPALTKTAKKKQEKLDKKAATKAERLEKQAAAKDKGKGKARQEHGSEEVADKAHAEVGREWVRRTLAKSGKTEADLAAKLWKDNLSAVLELCDDSFEEHVIATPEHWTGLHLHGLNHNTPHFNTESPEAVSTFAEEFGFIPTKFIIKQTLADVRAFTDEVAQSGSWEGDAIEGFVVRTRVRAADPADDRTKPPYLPSTPFFFKVKFEEPYLLYRTWREITRGLLPLLDDPTPSPAEEQEIYKGIKKKIKRPEAHVYARWCGRMMKGDKGLFEDYGRGVVRVREKFLEWIAAEGKEEWDDALLRGKLQPLGDGVSTNKRPPTMSKPELTLAQKRAERAGLPKKWIIMPVAVPGTGKTKIGLALSDIFGFGHTQSDDVTEKKSGPTFLKNVAKLLQTKDVVYADRNNHIEKHYEEFANLAFDKPSGNLKLLQGYDVRQIVIQWTAPGLTYQEIMRICSERVVKRGDNHPTLRAEAGNRKAHEAIIDRFLSAFMEPKSSDFPYIIKVDIRDTPFAALTKIVAGLSPVLNFPVPDVGALQIALDKTELYKSTTVYHPPQMPVRYYGIVPTFDLATIVRNVLESGPKVSGTPTQIVSSAQGILDQLVADDRITAKPHITLAHESSVKQEKAAAPTATSSKPGPEQVIWEQCKALAGGTPPVTTFAFTITHLVWDDRAMALVLSSLKSEAAVTLPQGVEENLHITVGTRDESIPAFESRAVVRTAKAALKSGGARVGETGEAVEGGGKVRWIAAEAIRGEGVLKGLW